MTLYVSDLDGTLLTKDERISAYSLNKLNTLTERGMLFTFASARSASSAHRAVQGLNLRVPAILYNGGLIYDFNTREVFYSALFTDEEKRYLLHVLSRFGITPFAYGALEEGRERVTWHEGDESSGMRRYISRRVGDDRFHAVATREELLSGYVFYFKCIGPREQLERAWNDLKLDDRFICIFHQETYASDFWMEISPRRASKANAVRFLKERLGCERVVCFGDTSNDSDMFDVCDEKYAVMNADLWLKEKATGVVGYCEEDGVAKWLEEHAGF